MNSNPSDPRFAELDALTARMRASLDPKAPPPRKPERLAEDLEDEQLAKLIENNRMGIFIGLAFTSLVIILSVVFGMNLVPPALIGVIVACVFGGSAFSAIKMLLERVRKLEARINSLEASLRK